MKKLCVFLTAATLALSSVVLAEDAAPYTAPTGNTATPAATTNVPQTSQKTTKRAMLRKKNYHKKHCNCGQS